MICRTLFIVGRPLRNFRKDEVAWPVPLLILDVPNPVAVESELELPLLRMLPSTLSAGAIAGIGSAKRVELVEEGANVLEGRAASGKGDDSDCGVSGRGQEESVSSEAKSSVGVCLVLMGNSEEIPELLLLLSLFARTKFDGFSWG